jgi:D-sedoheptulose 7-phosphate isomerase
MTTFAETLRELSDVLLACASLDSAVSRAQSAILDCLKNGGKLLTCGNGGSAADALHLAEELVGRYKSNRRALPAVCLNADVTALTCIGNDFGYEWVFSRQVEALACPGDVLVGFSTSGRSANVLAAFRRAREIGVSTIFVGGKDGGQTRGVCDHEIIVPSFVTARIQEVHTVVLHQWLEAIEVTDWQFSPIGRSRECEAPTAL